MSALELVPIARTAPATPGQADRARYLSRLSGPLEQFDFAIDGELLSQALERFEVSNPEVFGLKGFDFLSVADLVWPEAAISSLRQLAGLEPRSKHWPLAPGRLPLYVCPMCADLGCGAITVEVVHEASVVTWRDFQVEDGLEHNEHIDLTRFPSFTFDRGQYEAALTTPLPMLDELLAEEIASKAVWDESHGLRARGRFRRRPA
jgi:hypothetical protein